MDLNLTNLRDLESICEIALDYFDHRMGTTAEIEWLQRIAKYRQMFQAEICRLDVQQLAEKDAEIERLKSEIEIHKGTIAGLGAICRDKGEKLETKGNPG